MDSNAILVVEDEKDIREMLAFSLERAGFTVIPSETAEQALAFLEGPLPGLVIIDWMLPGMSGVELARKLRRDPLTSDLPLLMLTARGEEADKLKSFDAGIDDYVTKPFSPRELIARIRALRRRSGDSEDGTITFNGLTLDTKGHRLSAGKKAIHIGPSEFRLLELMMRNPSRVFSRTQLLDRVWGRNVYVEERTVDVYVLRLRRALAPFDMDRMVETVRGVGYRFSSHGGGAPSANDASESG
ncbi:MAG: phosphate regulon transcriptional regulatory protein PhoB [Gammaproteobacteria bacterium]|nr:phosphate regulon transcriptional regulatory protein PhoB [Gammaproteobacteria bacterium]